MSRAARPENEIAPTWLQPSRRIKRLVRRRSYRSATLAARRLPDIEDYLKLRLAASNQ
jgi:hypothetical protein